MCDHLSAVATAFDDRAMTYDARLLHQEVAEAVADFAALEEAQTGVDISAGMLAVARRELPGATLLQARAEKLPLLDAAIDLATFELSPDHSTIDRPYRTNHAPFANSDLVATAAAPAGFLLGRARTGRYAGEACLPTELIR